ncbi:RNA-directed DNA polymerase [Lactococcus petauri]|jgi:hypothetical protein|uniref:RNA-directed DNA polymerase n=1 Tax=Lactococcus petauri TaxID=1940789 RepID=UPI0022DF5BFE|nr:RNA-directed DNA polymerase [Lactococcus petauri]
MEKHQKSILRLSATEARDFFLMKESYFSINLPRYFDLDVLLKQAVETFGTSELKEIRDRIVKKEKGKNLNYFDFQDVNYTFQLNKTKTTYRPITLIHPYLYVDLVNFLTKDDNWTELLQRFGELREKTKSKIICHSLPFVPEKDEEDKKEASLKFWKDIEQESIKLSLEYNYLTKLDISNFYGSIYTHTIPWAFHGIDEAKKDKGNKPKLLGSKLDKKFRDMNNQETVTIPQGNKVSDLIAEVLLAYLDDQLLEKLDSNIDFKILRYRDDYRIFTNSSEDANFIKRELVTILQRHKLSLGESKTSQSSDIVHDSIKEDKHYWIEHDPVIKITNDKFYQKPKQFALKFVPFLRYGSRKLKNDRFKWIMDNRIYEATVQKHLLIIKEFADKYPNSGQLIGALKEFDNRVSGWKNEDFAHTGTDIGVLVAIVTDIIKSNPKATESGVKTISYLLSRIDYKTTLGEILESWSEQREIKKDFEYKFLLLNQIYSNLAKRSYNGYLEIWFQRLVVKNLNETSYFIEEYSSSIKNELTKLVCDVVRGTLETSIFQEEWLKEDKRINLASFINKEKIEELDDVIGNDEIRNNEYF